MSDQENEVLEDGIEEAKSVPNTGGSGVPAAEVPDPVGAKSSKRKADKDSGETAPLKMPGTKAGMIASFVNRLNGMKLSDMHNLYGSLAEESEEETEESLVDIDVSEDIDAMLADSDFSDDFKDKITTIFSAAVGAKVAQETARIEEEVEARFETEIDEAKDEIATQVDEYLSYATEEWMKDNEVAIVSEIRADVAESFFEGLKTLFAEHYVELPDEKVDVVAEMSQKVDELEEKLDEVLTQNAELVKENTVFKVEETFAKVVDGLADTEVEKMRTFAEGIDFSDENDFQSKMEVVRENYFPTKQPESVVDEDLEDPEEDNVVIKDQTMSAYSDAIRRTIRK